MRYLKRLARRYPMQTFLFLFNAGVFTWLQTTGTMIANRLGYQVMVFGFIFPIG